MGKSGKRVRGDGVMGCEGEKTEVKGREMVWQGVLMYIPAHVHVKGAFFEIFMFYNEVKNEEE